MNSKKLKNGDWKQVNGEILRCFERLTHPFFELIVNLLGKLVLVFLLIL